MSMADEHMVGLKRKLMTGCGSLHCTAFFDPGTKNLLELYLNKGSTGGCNNFMVGLSRMTSLAARSGASLDDILDQLDSCGACPSYAVKRATDDRTSPGSCCPSAVGKALKEMHDQLCGVTHSAYYDRKKPVNACPSCGSELQFEGGCMICKSCGWSRCERWPNARSPRLHPSGAWYPATGLSHVPRYANTWA